MSTVSSAPETAAPRRTPRQKPAGFVMIGIGLVAAATAAGMALFGGGGTKAPAVNKYAHTTTVVTAWWAALPAAQRTTDCSTFKSDPKGTIAQIQAAITTSSPAAAAVFDPTAMSAFFTTQCAK